MRRSKATAFLACLVTAGSAVANVAAAPPTKSAITIAIPDLGCNSLGEGTFEARGWSWGAELVPNEAFPEREKAELAGLVLTRGTDACSPALLRSLLMGVHQRELRLSQYDTNGVLKSTLSMLNVKVTDWHIAADAASADAAEQVTLTGARFTFTDVASGASFCWEMDQMRRC